MYVDRNERVGTLGTHCRSTHLLCRRGFVLVYVSQLLVVRILIRPFDTHGYDLA